MQPRRVAAGAATGDESPSKMMAVALEQQSALAGRAGCVKSCDRDVIAAENAMVVVDCQATFSMYEHGTNWT
jgi:hypothetical protein